MICSTSNPPTSPIPLQNVASEYSIPPKTSHGLTQTLLSRLPPTRRPTTQICLDDSPWVMGHLQIGNDNESWANCKNHVSEFLGCKIVHDLTLIWINPDLRWHLEMDFTRISGTWELLWSFSGEATQLLTWAFFHTPPGPLSLKLEVSRVSLPRWTTSKLVLESSNHLVQFAWFLGWLGWQGFKPNQEIPTPSACCCAQRR